MNTNIKVELTDEQRQQLGYNAFGSKKGITRKELNILVNMFVEQMLNPAPSPEDHPDNPVTRLTEEDDDWLGDGEVTQHYHAKGAPLNAAPKATPSVTGAKPARPNDASYMRGWNAVAYATRRMR